MKKSICLLFAFIFFFVSAEAKITRFLSGNSTDVQPVLFGPVFDLGGGGTDVDSSIQWMIDKARGCTNCAVKVDVVVIRASGSSGYNAPILAMNGVDSVETILMTSRRDSSNTGVQTTIRNAEVIFFAGGDQCNYVTNFKGTNVERAVEFVYSKGGAIGGTSAGMAIQSPYVYDACTGSVTSSEALSNPYHQKINFTYNLFAWNYLQTTITDTHFSQRDRMGRLFAFLARQIKDGISQTALGIASNESTSVVVDQAGIATVTGNGNGIAYFVLADHLPEVCVPNSPLTFSNYKIWKVAQGQTFDLQNRPSTGFYIISVNNGQLSENPY
jgi:cyanophycinase